MRKFTTPFILIPTAAFAAAPLADSFYNHRHWIFPAYAYCLVFGLIILFGLFLATIVWKSKTKTLTEMISQYFIKHRVLAIIFTGILLAIPIGIAVAALWELIWFLSILPFMGLMIAYPLILGNRHFREKWMLSSLGIKWSLMLAISSISATLVFVILTNCEMLPGTDITYFDRSNQFFSHPYDSIIEIWEIVPLFIVGIPFALLFYWLGFLNIYHCRKLSEFRRRKRETFHDIYIED